jgi:hypothetical protein
MMAPTAFSCRSDDSQCPVGVSLPTLAGFLTRADPRLPGLTPQCHALLRRDRSNLFQRDNQAYIARPA